MILLQLMQRNSRRARRAAQHIEVAGSKGNTSQTFANIVAVDLAWKKNGQQINNLFYLDKKKV